MRAAGPEGVDERLARHRNLGKAFYENPTTQNEAVEEFRKALALAPNSARERLNLRTGPASRGQDAEGIAELIKVQKQDPSIPHTWFNLGIAYKKAGEQEKAIAAVRADGQACTGRRRFRTTISERFIDSAAATMKPYASFGPPRSSILLWPPRISNYSIFYAPRTRRRGEAGARNLPAAEEAAGRRRDPRGRRVEYVCRGLRRNGRYSGPRQSSRN